MREASYLSICLLDVSHATSRSEQNSGRFALTSNSANGGGTAFPQSATCLSLTYFMPRKSRMMMYYSGKPCIRYSLCGTQHAHSNINDAINQDFDKQLGPQYLRKNSYSCCAHCSLSPSTVSNVFTSLSCTRVR